MWSGCWDRVAAAPAGKMPVAVMAEGAFSFKKLLDQCENQELEVAIRVALGETAGSLAAPGGASLQGNRAWGPRGWGREPRVWSPGRCGLL